MRKISKPVKIFISYASANRHFLEKFRPYLSTLRQQGLIDEWFDQCLDPGETWEATIKKELEAASVVLLLITEEFYASEWCWRECKIAFDKRQRGEAIVMPIIVKPVSWWKYTIAYSLQALPTAARAIVDWGNEVDAWTNVISGLEKAIHSALRTGILVPTELDKVLRPFTSLTAEIRDQLTHANNFWLMCRTSRGWWGDFGDLIDPILKRKSRFKNRLLILDPRSAAFALGEQEFQPANKGQPNDFESDFDSYQNKVIERISSLQSSSRNLEVRILDQVVRHVVLFVNPPSKLDHKINNSLSSVYYLLPSWNVDPGRYHEQLTVRFQHSDTRYYRELYDLYEQLWKTGKRWT